MNKAKRKRLESKGWKVGTVEEFLGLSPEESAYIELKLKLSESLKRYREQRNLTQTQLAQIVGSSQSRVAKMEARDGTNNCISKTAGRIEIVNVAFSFTACPLCI